MPENRSGFALHQNAPSRLSRRDGRIIKTHLASRAAAHCADDESFCAASRRWKVCILQCEGFFEDSEQKFVLRYLFVTHSRQISATEPKISLCKAVCSTNLKILHTFFVRRWR